jgi:WD40 repeat protein
MDAIGRVWDCRTGRNIFTCEGHVKAVLSLDFSPNGYQLATGSEDNTARVWDLRKRGVLAILPGVGDGGNGGLAGWRGGGRLPACLPAMHHDLLLTLLHSYHSPCLTISFALPACPPLPTCPPSCRPHLADQPGAV